MKTREANEARVPYAATIKKAGGILLIWFYWNDRETNVRKV